MKATTKVALTRAISIVAKGRGDGQEFLRLKISGTGEQPRQAILSIDAYLTDPLATIRALQLPLVSGVAQREFQARVQSALQRAVTFRVVTRPGWHGRLFVFPNGDVVGDQAFEVCLPYEANRYGRSSALRVLRFSTHSSPVSTQSISGSLTRSARRRRRRILSMEEFEAAPDRVIASLEAGLVTQSSRNHFRRCVREALRARTPTFRVATRPG